MKIILEQAKCIGCGSCSAIDSKNFKMKGTKAELIDAKKSKGDIFEKEVELTTDLQDACDSCPVICIHLKN